MTPSSLLVSIVVPTRNSARTIRACLESVRAQDHQAIELIVVDNSSGDATLEIARGLADVMISAGPERSAQRNVGAGTARGRYALFVDSDMILAPNVVAGCVTSAEDADAVVVPERSVGSGFWAACRALERACYLGDETIEAARFVDIDAFVRAGGYDATLPAGEDWDLHARLLAHGARVARADVMIDHDEGRLRLRDVVTKKFYYGRSVARYARKHPSLARRQLVFLRPAFVRHWRLLLPRPHLLGGIVVLKSIEFASGAAGALTTLLARTVRATAGRTA